MYEIKVSIIEKVNSFDGKLDALEREGAEAEALININDNLRLIANKAKYDAIVEQLMPIMDGYERLRKIAEKNGVPLMCGIQARLGANTLGIMRSVSVFEHYGKIKCTYCDGDRSHSIYPYNDEEDNYSPKGIITNWSKYNIIADLEKDLNKRIGEVSAKIMEKAKVSVDALASAVQ